jgi:hypothetical protein
VRRFRAGSDLTRHPHVQDEEFHRRSSAKLGLDGVVERTASADSATTSTVTTATTTTATTARSARSSDSRPSVEAVRRRQGLQPQRCVRQIYGSVHVRPWMEGREL